MDFKIHQYETEEAALAAVAIINTGEGIPVYDNATTQTYSNPYQHPEGYWYITADDKTIKYLGEPTLAATIDVVL